jgi:hypothetical protein
MVSILWIIKQIVEIAPLVDGRNWTCLFRACRAGGGIMGFNYLPAMYTFGPPVALLILGLAAGWILKGFRQ